MANTVLPDDLSSLSDEQLQALRVQYEKEAAGKPSTSEDIANVAMPALKRGAAQLVTTPGSLVDMVAKGVGAVSDNTLGPQSTISRGANAVQQGIEPITYPGVQKNFSPDMQYQAQTPGGKYVQTGLEWAPSVMAAAPFSPEGVIPALARGAVGAAGSEAAGQATEGTPMEPFARFGGGLASGFAPTGPKFAGANPERLAAANAAKDIMPISNADVKGSRLWATLEGQPPGGQAQQAQEGMLSKANAPQASTKAEMLSQWSDRVGARVNELKDNTYMYPPPSLNQGLANIVGQHVLNAPVGTDAYKPEVQSAFNTYNTLTHNGQLPLNGHQYWDLSSQWKSSGVPELVKMGQLLDTAMDVSNNGTRYNNAWPQWRTDFANFKGVQASHDPTNAMAPLAPEAVAKNIMKDTDLKKAAEGASSVMKDRPAPYDVSKVGRAISGLATVGGLGYGATHGGVNPAEAMGLIGSVALPHAMDATSQILGPPIHGIMRSAPVQAWGSRISPQTAATIMALRGPNAAEGMLRQPQEGQ